MEIAAFDFYDFGDIIHSVFGIVPTDPIDINFDSIGFESQYFMVNVGTMIVFYLIYTCALLLSTSLHPCANKRNKRVRNRTAKKPGGHKKNERGPRRRRDEEDREGRQGDK